MFFRYVIFLHVLVALLLNVLCDFPSPPHPKLNHCKQSSPCTFLSNLLLQGRKHGLNSVCTHPLSGCVITAQGLCLFIKDTVVFSSTLLLSLPNFQPLLCLVFSVCPATRGSNHFSNIQALKGCGEWPHRYMWLHKETNPFFCEQG